MRYCTIAKTTDNLREVAPCRAKQSLTLTTPWAACFRLCWLEAPWAGRNTQTIAGHPGLRPDILLTTPGRAPVVLETEYMLAASETL